MKRPRFPWGGQKCLLYQEAFLQRCLEQSTTTKIGLSGWSSVNFPAREIWWVAVFHIAFCELKKADFNKPEPFGLLTTWYTAVPLLW